jgi:23S rRNA (guanine2445-N2)-methyltransferase / 23S rRNA (guanine2069-N7)-methyltransferase
MRAMTNTKLTLSLTCPVELENALQRELDHLAIPVAQMGRGFAEITADLETAYKLVLWSRVANRVLLPILRVPLIDEEGFYESMKSVHWENWCEADASLAIQWTLASGNHHGQFFMYRLKDAICDRFKEKFDQRPSVDTNKPDIVFHLLLTDKEAAVYLDLGGGSLHRRGYREGEDKKYRAAAPLKENLAAALLYLTDWHTGKQAILFDPLCGSGTLLIEAALMRAERAPGLLACGRRGALPCPGWLQHDVVALETSPGKILFGLDGDKQAVNQALQGAALAQVDKWIHVERREMGQLLEWPRLPQLQAHESALVITNPPYGERLGQAENMPYLYQHLGNTLQQALPGKTLALLCGSKQQATACGVTPSILIYRQRVHNGPIGCDFSVSTIAKKSVGADSKSARAGLEPVPTKILQLDSARYDAALKRLADAEYKDSALSLLNRMRKNAKGLHKWIEQEKIECYRLYDADIPELNVAIDIYRDHLHIQEYAAPASVDDRKAEQRFAIVKKTLENIFPDAAGIHCKVRRKQKIGQQYGRHDETKSYLEVVEGKTKLLVNLDDYLDTGLFLDHRPIRLRIGQQSNHKRFLNLFCYTGSATLHAVTGGAKNSVSVDLSPAYIQWAKSNLALNGSSEAAHRFVQADVMGWLALCRDQFDLIFIDPPTFSNSKRSDKDFDVQKDHVALIDMAMKRLEPGGELIFSNNFRRFVLDESLMQRYTIEDITAASIPPDFNRPGKPIHRCWLIRR